MPAIYESLHNTENNGRSKINKQNNYLKCSIFMIAIFSFITAVFSILIFFEFFQLLMAIQSLKHNPALAELGEIKVGEINNFLDVMRSLKLKQIEKILSSISYNDVEEFFTLAEACFIDQCGFK